MKAMTYNILNGGQDNLDFARLETIIDVVNSVGPDILVVQEAQHFDLAGQRIFHRFETSIHRRGILALAKTSQHVAVFLPRDARIVQTHVDAFNFHHALLRIKIELANGDILTVLGTHLCPHGGHNRLGEAQRIANYARERDLVLLLGDLNSVDARADHSTEIQKLPSHYRARHLLPGSSSEIDSRAIQTLEYAGFVDLHARFSPGKLDSTAPTRLGGREFSAMRVDYIFGTPRIAESVVNFSVIKSAEADRSSDHYPVVVELDLEL
jgi:endonuclease/exonuclease/phosphatase family metal-dependent hydrolase